LISSVLEMQTVIMTIIWWVLSLSKGGMQKFCMERFNLKKLNYMEVKWYGVKISNGFAALENLVENVDQIFCICQILEKNGSIVG
jgi:hypothetical protein